MTKEKRNNNKYTTIRKNGLPRLANASLAMTTPSSSLPYTITREYLPFPRHCEDERSEDEAIHIAMNHKRDVTLGST